MDTGAIQAAIFDVYRECGVTAFPIDCIGILCHYGYTVLTYTEISRKSKELYELCMKFSNDSFHDGVNKLIAYNSKMPWERSRFSLMHELGHIILGHSGETEANEAEANFFAGQILAPAAAVRKLGCSSSDQIHDIFRISYMAANYALSLARQHRVYTIVDLDLEAWFWPSDPDVLSTEAPFRARTEDTGQAGSDPDVRSPERHIPHSHAEKQSPSGHPADDRSLPKRSGHKKRVGKQRRELEERAAFMRNCFDGDAMFCFAEDRKLYGF